MPSLTMTATPPLNAITIKQKFFDFTKGEDYLTIKLAANGARIEGKTIKNVSYETLAKSIKNETSLDTKYLPLMGSDYIGIRRYLVSKGKHYVFVEATPSIREIGYAGSSDTEPVLMKVPFPGILFVMTLKENSEGDLQLDSNECRLFALDGPMFNDSAVLYKYPFTNVYNDYRICWGHTLDNINVKNMNILQGAGLLHLFLTSINNEDLWSSSNYKLDNKPSSCKVLFQELEKDRTFNSKAMTKAMTAAGLISLITQNDDNTTDGGL